jgi:hypothetical protein
VVSIFIVVGLALSRVIGAVGGGFQNGGVFWSLEACFKWRRVLEACLNMEACFGGVFEYGGVFWRRV